MIDGFQKIVEERILAAQRTGAFEKLSGSGEPIVYADDRHIPEELRLAYKILKNADCLPPEIDLKKEITRTEDLLAGMDETPEKYRLLKKLNFMIMKLNTLRNGAVMFEMPQKYAASVVDRLETNRTERQKDHSE